MGEEKRELGMSDVNRKGVFNAHPTSRLRVALCFKVGGKGMGEVWTIEKQQQASPHLRMFQAPCGFLPRIHN